MSNNSSGWPIPSPEEVEALVKLQKAREKARQFEFSMMEREHQIQYQKWLMDEKKRLRRAKIWQRKQDIARALHQANVERERAEREERKQARLAKLAANPPPPPASKEALRRSRVNWAEYLGNEMVAARQVAWERNATALAMREAGLTFKAIGHKFGVSSTMGNIYVWRGERDRKSGRRSPAEEFMAMPLLLVEPPKLKPVKEPTYLDLVLKYGGGG